MPSGVPEPENRENHTFERNSFQKNRRSKCNFDPIVTFNSSKCSSELRLQFFFWQQEVLITLWGVTTSHLRHFTKFRKMVIKFFREEIGSCFLWTKVLYLHVEPPFWVASRSVEVGTKCPSLGTPFGITRVMFRQSLQPLRAAKTLKKFEKQRYQKPSPVFDLFSFVQSRKRVQETQPPTRCVH